MYKKSMNTVKNIYNMLNFLKEDLEIIIRLYVFG